MGEAALGPDRGDPTTTPHADSRAPLDAADPLLPNCGKRLYWQPRQDLPLQITATIPTEPLTEQLAWGLTQVDMRVTNVSDTALRVTTGRGAHLTLVKDGLVVATPAGQRDSAHTFNLEPGASRHYKSAISLRRCGSDPPSTVPLEPGTYQLYAAQPFTLGEDRQTWLVVQAGPWPVTVARTEPGPRQSSDSWTRPVGDARGNAYSGPGLDPGELTFGGCGAQIGKLATGHLPLRLTAILPSGALTAETPLLRAQIEMRVTNVSTSVLHLMTQAAKLTVAQNGIVVSMPARQRGSGHVYVLQPGASQEYKSSVNLRRCNRAPDTVSLRPGSYQLYAAQPFFLLGEPEGQGHRTLVVVRDGPWDFEVA
ncbi:MAG TPA: hypothetical protein VFG33_05210 [Kribbella sp.]|uniref:hypothetical protein n=1 Tax=Kribbella sp. TaxID=1871183 RepID=UPI002D7798A7|nr:hypothetical protein [Kribbella sp.]HET6292746.1 hypothetical protein [Kribbella sp.]